MPPRRRATAPPPIDIEAVRRKLADGRIVRVGISRSAQFPEGGTGRVRSVGNPQTDGEEYVQVELSLNGMKDVLPFTPADLTPATRGRPPGPGRQASQGATAPGGSTQRGSTPPASAHQSPAHQSPAQQAPSQPTGADSAPKSNPVLTTASPGARDATAGDAVLRPRENGVPPSAIESGQHSPTPEIPAPEAASAAKAKLPRGARRPAAVSVTMATSSSEPTQWRIEARIGNKVAVKSAAVSPARVWDLVQALENEALSRAVGAILDEQRSAAQARARALASELAAVQAELQALPDARQ